MKNGYTVYDDHNQKLEITINEDGTVYIESGDVTDWEHSTAMELPYKNFVDFIRIVAGQLFDISGEHWNG